MRNDAHESTSTPDGILRRPEVDPDFLKGANWDGRFSYSYVPPPAAELRLPPEVSLHSEFDLDVDPVTYQVLRNRFWSINLDHSDTIRRVSGSPQAATSAPRIQMTPETPPRACTGPRSVLKGAGSA